MRNLDFGSLDIGRLKDKIEDGKSVDSLRAYIRSGWNYVEPADPLIPNWHVDAIADHLSAVTDGKIRRLLINIPPGFAKSLLGSVLWPTWTWLKNPQWRLLSGAYGIDLATRDMVKSRDLMETDWYQRMVSAMPADKRWEFSSRQDVKQYYENTRKGFRIAVSPDSRATGFRGHCVLVDDPINIKDGQSESVLGSTLSWWTNTLQNRVNNLMTGSFVVIMQRVSENDIAGHILRTGGFETLILPAEFEPERRFVTSIGWTDPRKKEGDLIFPQRFPAESLEAMKANLGENYSAQYQQRPSPAGGGIWKRHWWRFWQYPGQDLQPVAVRDDKGETVHIAPVDLPEQLEKAQSWDCAFKDTKASDYVVGNVWGRMGSQRYLLREHRQRMDLPATLAAVREMTREFPDTHLKLVEDKANGSAVIQVLTSEIDGLVAVNPEGSKIARARAVSPQIEAGNVFLPHPSIAPWVQEYIEECGQFPKGRFDDRVDATSQMLLRWKVGPVEMFPSFRMVQRRSEPGYAVHVYQHAELKDWWTRWVSVHLGNTCAAHWWVSEPNGRCRVYRELIAEGVTAEEFGKSVAASSMAEAGNTRTLPVWLDDGAFSRAADKSMALSFAEGIQVVLGAERVFLGVHTDAERIMQPDARAKAYQARMDRYGEGFLSVMAVRGETESAGWNCIREMLRWTPPTANTGELDPQTLRRIWDTDPLNYAARVAELQQTPDTAPMLMIAETCPKTVLAMSQATRTTDGLTPEWEADAALQSIKIGGLASRRENMRPPKEVFIGNRMDKIPENATGIGRFLAAQKAEDDYAKQYSMEPISFSRRRR